MKIRRPLLYVFWPAESEAPGLEINRQISQGFIVK